MVLKLEGQSVFIFRLRKEIIVLKSVSLPKNNEKAHSETLVSSVSSVLCVWVQNPKLGGEGRLFFSSFLEFDAKKKTFSRSDFRH